MPKMIDRVEAVVEVRESRLKISQQVMLIPGRDSTGTISLRIGSDLRSLGVMLFTRDRDTTIFSRNLAESAAIQKWLFERRNRGEPIADSFVVMLSYVQLFDALAAGDMELATSLACLMGGRDELEKEFDHPFDLAMGYALRAVVLNRPDEAETWLPRLIKQCSEKSSADFMGYTQVFNGILKSDSTLVYNGLKAVVIGHEKQSKGRGVFVGTEDELLCVWGIGAANLARSRGLSVHALPPLIPAELLI